MLVWLEHAGDSAERRREDGVGSARSFSWTIRPRLVESLGRGAGDSIAGCISASPGSGAVRGIAGRQAGSCCADHSSGILSGKRAKNRACARRIRDADDRGPRCESAVAAPDHPSTSTQLNCPHLLEWSRRGSEEVSNLEKRRSAHRASDRRSLLTGVRRATGAGDLTRVGEQRTHPTAGGSRGATTTPACRRASVW